MSTSYLEQLNEMDIRICQTILSFYESSLGSIGLSAVIKGQTATLPHFHLSIFTIALLPCFLYCSTYCVCVVLTVFLCFYVQYAPIHQNKFQVGVNLLGNKYNSDSERCFCVTGLSVYAV